MASLLVLWDVDFTLVNAAGAGRHLYQLAFAELYGRELPQAATEAGMAGRTDHAIALEVLERARIADPRSQVSRFEAAMTRLAPSVAELVETTAKVLPGAEAALAAIAALSADGRLIQQSLLTGNIRALAEVKLRPLGVAAAYLDLDIGAYGDESEHRAELVHLARDRAYAAYDTDFGGEATVLVGDTPLDVGAALAAGARAIGVATGQFTAAELAASGAHAVLGDLSDTDEVLAALLRADLV